MAKTTTPPTAQEVIEAVHEWAGGSRDDPDRLVGDAFERYFHGIAEARFVIRKVFRIVDEQAKSAGLEPLEHQALIQIFGASNPMRVIDLSDRLDIAAAFASRLAKRLEDRNLVVRSPSEEDRRSKHVVATPQARELLASIDEKVHLHVEYFQRQLSNRERVAALGIFAFYLGGVQQKTSELEVLVEREAHDAPRARASRVGRG